MKLRTVFLLGFAAASLPAIGASAWIAARSARSWTDSSAAVLAAQAMGHTLHLVEALGIERGALQEAVLSANPDTDALRAIGTTNDALLARTETALRRAALPEGAVTQARTLLLAARSRVAAAIAHPLSERDPDLVPALLQQINERLDAVQTAVALAEGRAARASPSVGALVAVGSLAVDMRDTAGRRSSLLSFWLGGRTLTPDQADTAMQLTGRLRQAWERIQRQVEVVGAPARLVVALRATRANFFAQAEPRYRALLDRARAGGDRPLTLAAYQRWTTPALTELLASRDAAIVEALSDGTATAAYARDRMIVAAVVILAELSLATFAVLVLLRRLILPMQRLTGAVTRIAAGDAQAPVPERGREDEIGAMAAAIEVFKDNAIRVGQREAELEQTHRHFDAALGNMSQGLCLYDGAERLAVVNRRFCEIARLPPERVQPGMTFRALVELGVALGNYPGRSAEQVYAERRALIMGKRPVTFSVDLRGDQVVEISLQPLVDGGWVSTFEDVTERRRAEARIAFMARHDALTGLPSRALLRERMEEVFARGENLAVLFLDLDHFKSVNDTLGHPVGDALLRAVAERLRGCVRDADTVARLGGDEFAIIQVGPQAPDAPAALAQRLVDVVRAPYQLGIHHLDVGTSIGIAIAGEDGHPDRLLERADMALYAAKGAGRGTFRFFEPAMEARLQSRRALELDLRAALAGDGLELAYQPVVDLRSGRIGSFEALLRWHHAVHGLVAPADFIPIAEEVGLIAPLGEWVLRRACAEAASWPDDVSVAINLSPVQLRNPDLPRAVAGILARSGLPSRRLEMEITETALLQDNDATLAVLQELRALGVRIALDDFGTGYSSLSTLRAFPFDRIKIDRSFVRDLPVRADAVAIVGAVAGLAAALGMATTAEGVETAEQLARVRAGGCTEAQGYLFSPPVPATEAARMLCRGAASATRFEDAQLAPEREDIPAG